MKSSSPFGEFAISLPLAPVSQQARADSKAAVQASVRLATTAFEFLLLGDVSVNVEWTVSERARYETDRTPDVDNILKPLLDALTGPNGVLIDDNQIQHVSCHWIDTFSDEESLTITVRHSPDEWIVKAGIFFVQLKQALCMPLSSQTPIEFQLKVVDTFTRALDFREEALNQGIHYQSAKLHMPVQRMFHRTRVGAFEVIDLEAFLAKHAP